jgi:hypothetical protein
VTPSWRQFDNLRMEGKAYGNQPKPLRDCHDHASQPVTTAL